MDEWLHKRLSTCLDFPVPNEMIEYVLSLKEMIEIDEYFSTLLNFELPEHRLFLNDFKQRLLKKNVSPPDGTSYNKKKPVNNRNIPVKKNEKYDGKQKAKEEKIPESLPTKRKTKYVNLYTSDGDFTDVVLLKGRHRCECQASKHKLINNCLKCGRIICEQEGSGPCLFCGNVVCSEEEIKIIDSSTKKGDHLKRSIAEQSRPKGWEEALTQRNRLLEYDRASEKRTTIIDDESDYFKANSVWLSDAERKKLKKIEDELRDKKHASRLSKKVTIDFAGRKIIDEPQISAEYEDEVLKEIAKSCSNVTRGKKITYDNPCNEILSDAIHPFHDGPIPMFDVAVDEPSRFKSENLNDGIYSRIQDKEYLEISDLRNCLSMHQPWASMLVTGIKQQEGRTWYSSHRGRLWIAATAKPADVDDIKRMENFYRIHYKNEHIEFPSQYPSGCLLGCVLVQDCLPQEEYVKNYPEGEETDSPFIFICSNFQELPIRFPVKGQHKIYKLDPQIHLAAVKSLQRISKIKAEKE